MFVCLDCVRDDTGCNATALLILMLMLLFCLLFSKAAAPSDARLLFLPYKISWWRGPHVSIGQILLLADQWIFLPEVWNPSQRENSMQQFCMAFLRDLDNKFIDLRGKIHPWEYQFLLQTLVAQQKYCLEMPSAVLLLVSLFPGLSYFLLLCNHWHQNRT